MGGCEMIQRKPDARGAKPMTAAELRRRMERAHLSPEELAARLEISTRRVYQMLKGDAIKYLIAYAVRHL